MNRSYFEEFRCGKYSYEGIVKDAYDFTTKKQLLRKDLWEKFSNQFKIHSDTQNKGWRGEFWGKMMRGSAGKIYDATHDIAVWIDKE